MKILVYIGCVVAFILFNIPYGPLVALCNVFIYCVSLMLLMTFLNAKQFKSDWMDEIKYPWMIILAVFGVGPLLSGYYFYRFYKKPITKNVTEEEFDAKIKTDIRNKRLNKVLR